MPSTACRLCGEDRVLKNSHIIPNFVIRWLKKSGATPFLRGVEEPDTRIQDVNEKLLCGECEQRLGRWEQRVASNIFHPVIRKEKECFEYDTWLQYFAISLSWRYLVSDFCSLDEWDSHEQAALQNAEREWRAILNGEQQLSSESYSHHIVLLGETESVSEKAPDAFEFYLSRGIDATVVSVHDGIHVYTKFPQMFFLSCIDPPEVDGLERTLINQSGVIRTPQFVHSPWSNIPFLRAQTVSDNPSSEAENEKIKQHILEHPRRLASSETLETSRRSLERKGKGRHDPTKYLDRTCPICGTHHRVVEAIPSRQLTRSDISSLVNSNEIAYAKGIFINLDENTEQEPDMTGTFILSTNSATRVLTLLDPGWVVDREIDHMGVADPEELGSVLWELVRDEYATWMEKHAPGKSFSISG